MTRLALVMIARDEALVIGRALKSAAPHVDRMIVLDTGSADATIQIAQDLGAEVHRFVWCDDFAAARNAALGHSDADWNLILDADEWLEGEPADLAMLALSPRSDQRFVGLAQVASRTDQGGHESLSRTWIARILPRGVRYTGRVHEQPQSDLPHRRLQLRLGHDGYLAAHLARKAGRNETLLLREIEAEPQDGYLWFQLAREYQVGERAAQAALCFTEALRLAPAHAPFRHALVVRAITALKTAGHLDDADTLARSEIDNWPNSPDFFFALGDLYLELASANPDRALGDLLPVAENAWKRCLEIGERDDLDGSVTGRGSYMAAHNLAAFYDVLGQATLAAEYQALSDGLRRTAPG